MSRGSVREREAFIGALVRILADEEVEAVLDLGRALIRRRRQLTLLAEIEGARGLTEEEEAERVRAKQILEMMAWRHGMRAEINRSGECHLWITAEWKLSIP